MSETEEKWLKGAKKAFDESVENLDAATLSRLNRGRQKALQAASSGRREWNFWVPATGVAAAAVIAVMMVKAPAIEELQPPATASSDFEILLGDEEIEFLEELEFYSWLDTADFEEATDVG